MLYIRKPGDDNETCVQFADDDPFFSEISNFIDIVENGDDYAQILSSYEGTNSHHQFTPYLGLM